MPEQQIISSLPRKRFRFDRNCLALFVFASIAGCSQIGVDPEEPAAIELSALPFPAVVIGDSLRNGDGVATPVQAIVRNIRGEIIDNANVTYVYAEYNRDSALTVDPSTGFVTAVKKPEGEARIAARIGSALQVLRPIRVTLRPDSLDRDGEPEPVQLTTTLPDTNRASAQSNTTQAINVDVRHISDDMTTEPVADWVVTYTLVHPANPANDSTFSAFLVNESGRASSIDTTSSTGVAARQVRIRASQFPPDGNPDSIVVEASASYRGTALRGAPVRVVIPVLRGTPASASATAIRR